MATISLAQAYVFALQAGFTGQAVNIIVAIAQAESGLNPAATNTNTDSHLFPDGHTGPSTDRGILQINNYWQPQIGDVCAFNPECAFRAAYAISNKGTDFTPWSTYKSGAYKGYLMTSSATSRLLPNAVHFSEFQHGYTGTCGETALAAAMVCSSPPIETQTEAISLMLSMTADLVSLGMASASGATTMAALHAEATKRGFVPVASSFVSFKQPLDATTLHPYLLANAGVVPIVIEIANGGALRGDEVGLHYHFICVVGISPQGYICMDGDNSYNGLVTYSWAMLEAAIPCALMALEMGGGKAQGVPMATIPTGWKDNGTVLTAPNGVTVEKGMRSYVLEHNWNAANLPLAAARDEAVGSFSGQVAGGALVQDFKFSTLVWTAKSGVLALAEGEEVEAMRKKIAALEAQLAAPVVVPAPQPAPQAVVDPSVKNALSAALQLLQPQATLSDEITAALKTLS